MKGFEGAIPEKEDAYVRSTYLGCVRRPAAERMRGGNTRKGVEQFEE